MSVMWGISPDVILGLPGNMVKAIHHIRQERNA